MNSPPTRLTEVLPELSSLTGISRSLRSILTSPDQSRIPTPQEIPVTVTLPDPSHASRFPRAPVISLLAGPFLEVRGSVPRFFAWCVRSEISSANVAGTSTLGPSSLVPDDRFLPNWRLLFRTLVRSCRNCSAPTPGVHLNPVRGYLAPAQALPRMRVSLMSGWSWTSSLPAPTNIFIRAASSTAIGALHSSS